MRQTAALFFVLLFTLPLWVKGVVLLHFWANRAYIAERFCENKDKPQLHCEGKCYLHKQLKKAEPPEQDSPAPTSANGLKKWELADFDFPVQFIEQMARVYLFTRAYFHYRAVALRGFSNCLEQPPDDGENTKIRALNPLLKIVHLSICQTHALKNIRCLDDGLLSFRTPRVCYDCLQKR